MKRSALIDQIKQKSSFLCVGLDIDLEKIPTHLLKVEDPLFSFSKAIVDATVALAIDVVIDFIIAVHQHNKLSTQNNANEVLIFCSNLLCSSVLDFL